MCSERPASTSLDTVATVRLVLAACVLALALGACSGGSSQGTSSTTTSTAAPGVSSQSPCPGFRGTELQAASSGERPAGLLTDADAGAAGCLDRVTFSFRSLGDSTPPGYVVEYRDPPFTDGDPPREVALSGDAFLSVTITPAASVDITQEDHPPTYSGNLLLRYGEHHHLQMIRKFDDALGSVRWVIALDEKRPFLVDSAADPTRITIYIG